MTQQRETIERPRGIEKTLDRCFFLPEVSALFVWESYVFTQPILEADNFPMQLHLLQEAELER